MTITKHSRTRNRAIDPQYKDFVYTYNGTPYITPYVVRTDEEAIEDVVTENYKQLISQGVIINNPCTYTRESTASLGNGAMTQQRLPTYDITMSGPVSRHLFSYIIGGPRCSPPAFAADGGVAQATAKLQAIANIDSSPYAFGEDTLEIKETVKFLRNPIKGLYELSKAFSKKKQPFSRYNLKKRADALANLWLEYQFAASPLVRSACDALEAYSSVEPALPERLSARGKQVISEKTADTPSLYSGGTTYTYERSCVEDREYKATILYEVSNPARDWRYRLGFRVKDWPTTFWQVVPYSFMVDRLFDVTRFSQGVINLVDPRVTILAASTTSKVNRTYTGRCTGSSRPSWVCTGQGEEITEFEFGYHRFPWSPSFRDTVPQFKPAELVNSVTKLADLTALVYKNFT